MTPDEILSMIRFIKIRPLLWDKKHEDYKNRIAHEEAWLEVAAAVQRDKEEVRSKWRNLRDQFHRELRRVKDIVPDDPRPSGELLAAYEGKWVYFKRLLFLKDTILLAINKTDTVKTEESFEETTNLDDIYENVAESSYPQLLVEPLEFVEPERKRFKRKAYGLTEFEEKLLESQNNILTVLVKDRDESNDEDLMFVKSLVPYFKKLDPVKKLMMRNDIQNLFLKEFVKKDAIGMSYYVT